MAKRKALRVVLGIVLAIVLVPIAFIARAAFFPPTFPVTSIAEETQTKDEALLAKAWALPVAARYRSDFAFQSNGSRCGPSSVANVARSLGRGVATESSVLDGTGKCWSGICFMGLTLDQLAEVGSKATARKVMVVRDLDYSAYRALLPTFNDLSRRVIVNFHRGMLFGKGVGHHSPIGGYLPAEDLVFVLDVNDKFKPWLVTPKRLFDAIDTVDSSAGKKRGFLIVEAPTP